MTTPYTIDHVELDAETGLYYVGFECRTGFWSAYYTADGLLDMTLWKPAAHVPWIDPFELARLAAAD